MSFEWDPAKAETNFRKHGVRFSDAASAFYDDYAITVADDSSDSDEQRFATIGAGVGGCPLVVVYSYRGKNLRIISARLATRSERRAYETNR